MSNSTAKKRAKMHEAKKALDILNSYAQNINEPEELAELLNLHLQQVYQHADKLQATPLKAVYAFAYTLHELNRRAVKVRFASRRNLKKEERNALILKLRQKGKSYQEISDILKEREIFLTKSAVYKIVQKFEEPDNGF